jgi:hypothetical protein
VGTPAASDIALAPGAGHGDEGDASNQGPAQETDQAQSEALPAQPKPTNADADIAMPEQAPGAVIELAAVTTKLKAAEAALRETDGLVTVRPKPERRKNARERAKEKYTKDRTTPDTTATATSKVETKAKANGAKPARSKTAKAKKSKTAR